VVPKLRSKVWGRKGEVARVKFQDIKIQVMAKPLVHGVTCDMFLSHFRRVEGERKQILW
jgi:catabolite regulation protein CreA